MRTIFSFSILLVLVQNVVFAEGNQETSRTISPSDVSYEDLLYVYLKGSNTELTNQVIENYINDFYENDYRNYRQNEFEWPAILNRHRTELVSKINDADLSKTYTFQTRANLGTYNFELGGFDVGVNMEYLFVGKSGLSIEQGSVNTGLSSKAILIFVNNITGFNFFEMDRNEANTFINSRTKNGNIDRNVTLHISFSISNFFPNTGIFLIAQSNNSISARVTKIDVYDGPKKIGELTSKNLVAIQNQPDIPPPVFYDSEKKELYFRANKWTDDSGSSYSNWNTGGDVLKVRDFFTGPLKNNATYYLQVSGSVNNAVEKFGVMIYNNVYDWTDLVEWPYNNNQKISGQFNLTFKLVTIAGIDFESISDMIFVTFHNAFSVPANIPHETLMATISNFSMSITEGN